MGEEVSRASGPGRTGAPGPYSERPLGITVPQSRYPFEKFPVAAGWREQTRNGSGAEAAAGDGGLDLRGVGGLERW